MNRFKKHIADGFVHAKRRYEIVLSKHGDNFNDAISELCQRLSVVSDRVSRNRHTIPNTETIHNEEEEKYLMQKLGLI